jgi:RsiW-degrading membrane proteinase PrsW (M82 family)
VAEEAAALLALAALTSFTACWALYNPDSPEDWDSMRLFLAVLFVVALGAAPLVMVPQAFRRVVVSVLIVLHLHGGGVRSARPVAGSASLGAHLSALSRIHVPQ